MELRSRDNEVWSKQAEAGAMTRVLPTEAARLTPELARLSFQTCLGEGGTFPHAPEREWSARLIWEVVPAHLESITQQGRQAITAATAKAERNFLEKCKLSRKEVHSRHPSGCLLDFQNQVSVCVSCVCAVTVCILYR